MQGKQIILPDLPNFERGDVIIFFDKKTKQHPDDTGCNQAGISLSGNRILFSRNKKVIITDLNRIDLSRVKVLSMDNSEISTKMLNYFKTNIDNYYLISLGFHALSYQKKKIFEVPEIMPKFTVKLSDEQYEIAWSNLFSKLQPADTILSFNERSMISRFISKLDKGSWSHAMKYVGNGEIVESVFQGVIKRRLDVYKQKHIHIGVYRIIDLTPERQQNIVKNSLSFIGLKYNFKGAFRIGLKTLFGSIKYHKEKSTPNGLVYSGNYYLVDYV
jgi:hypothetical protein